MTPEVSPLHFNPPQREKQIFKPRLLDGKAMLRLKEMLAVWFTSSVIVSQSGGKPGS